jgi:hypothetical protein
MLRRSLASFVASLLAVSAVTFAASSARAADEHPPVRLGLAVAPATVGYFGLGSDGHDDLSPFAFSGRLGVMYAPIRHFQIGVDAMVLAPYDGKVVHYAAQVAARGALPIGDSFELGLTARFGPGFARLGEGLAQRNTRPYTTPGPAITYFGWQAGLALDATIWLKRDVALVFALEAIMGDEKSTAGDDIYLGYLHSRLGPYAIAPWIGLQIGL